MTGQDLIFGVSEQEILSRVNVMIGDTDYMQNHAVYRDDWDQQNPSLSSWELFFDLEHHIAHSIDAEREGVDSKSWLLKAKWDQKKRERPDSVPTIYADDLAGWEADIEQLTCDGNPSVTQRELGEADPSQLIDYLETSKKIATACAEQLGAAKDVADRKLHISNMKNLVAMADARLEALSQGRMFITEFTRGSQGMAGKSVPLIVGIILVIICIVALIFLQ